MDVFLFVFALFFVGFFAIDIIRMICDIVRVLWSRWMAMRKG
jgi:hypothetical protein